MKVTFYRRLFQWRWRATAANNRIIGASSEGFFNYGDCVDNARLLGRALNENFKEVTLN